MFSIEDIIGKYDGTKINLPSSLGSFLKLVDVDKHQFDTEVHLQSTCSQPFGASDVVKSHIENYKIIAQGEDVKTVYDLSLSVSALEYEYNPGDTVGILTKNFDHDVDYLIEHLELGSSATDQIYRVEVDPASKKKSAKIPVFIPAIIQIRKLFSECLDLKAIPKKLFIRALVDHTSEEIEKHFLTILCNKDGTAFDDVVLKHELGFLALLKSVPSCKPPVSLLIEHLPRLMPRPYSIANWHESNPAKIRIIFSVHETEPGLTSSMLQSSCVSSAPVYLYFRKSNSFSYTQEDLDKDILMIGVGTGIAPYLAFLERRRAASEQARCDLGKAWLFAGFRYELKSYLCREEITQFLKSNSLQKLLLAFSRDPTASFRYIQDQMDANKEEFVKIFQSSNCKLFVCGNGKVMLPQIEDKIVQILSDALCICAEEAKSLVAEKKKSLCYVEDLWL